MTTIWLALTNWLNAITVKGHRNLHVRDHNQEVIHQIKSRVSFEILFCLSFVFYNVFIKMSEEKPHHKQLELCTTRPVYRQGRKLTAVKVKV